MTGFLEDNAFSQDLVHRALEDWEGGARALAYLAL